MLRKTFVAIAAIGLLAVAAAPASAQPRCLNRLCYVDLKTGFNVCNPQVFTAVATGPILIGPNNPGCDANLWQAARIEVQVPPECDGIAVWLDYVGEPEGWTLNIGDSATNNGFGGDAGTLPPGQNAEVQILDQTLSVFNAASVPEEVDQIAVERLTLLDGGFKFVAEDQFLSWGQPYGEIKTPNLERMFFLSPQDDNRTLYVGLNRVIAAGTNRYGCGARHAFIFVQ